MDEWWQRVTTTSPQLDTQLGLLMAALAAACIVWSPIWRVTRHVVTVVHEGAHGVVALVAGRRLAGIRLHSDSSGLTVSSGRPRGPGMIATLFAGYVGTGVLGVLLAAGIRYGQAIAALWVLLLALAVLLVQIRNLYGLWVVVVSAAALFAITWWADPQAQVAAAHVIAWFLLLTCPWSLWDLQRTRRAGRGQTSDPDQLSRISPFSGGFWLVLMMLVALGCLVLGGWLLLQ